ncbi:MAG: acylneuraminate cytidylyltransferase family protein [Acidobacteriota bacterium]
MSAPVSNPRVVAVIPARGGSKGLPGKHLKLLAGKPLLAYAIEPALRTTLINRVIVTTDSQEIADAARALGAEAPFLRPGDLADDAATTEAALQHAVLWLDEHEGYRADIVVFLTCTAIFRQQAWLEEAVRRLIQRPDLDTVFVGLRTHKNFWRRSGTGWARLASDIPYGSRQNREALLREETPTACATRADLIRGGRRVGPNVDIIETDDDRVMLDLHSDFDLWLAEQVLVEWPKLGRPI